MRMRPLPSVPKGNLSWRPPEWIFFKKSLLRVRGRSCIDPPAAAGVAEPWVCVRALVAAVARNLPVAAFALVEGPPEGKQLLFSPSSSLSSSVPLLASFPSPFALYDLHVDLRPRDDHRIAAQLNPSHI